MPVEIATATSNPPNPIVSSPATVSTAPPEVIPEASPPSEPNPAYPPVESSQPKSTTNESAVPAQRRLEAARKRTLEYLEWIRPHLNRRGLVPVLRSSVALFVGLVLLLVQRTQLALGQGAFIVLIGELLDAPRCAGDEIDKIHCSFQLEVSRPPVFPSPP